MKYLKEITEWEDGTPNHIYIFDGSNCVGYIKKSTNEKIMFNKTLKKFDKKGRKFQEIKL